MQKTCYLRTRTWQPTKGVNNVNWKKVQGWRYRFRRRKLTSETWVILFSLCLFFLIKANKKNNYQLENKEIKNLPPNLKKNRKIDNQHFFIPGRFDRFFRFFNRRCTWQIRLGFTCGTARNGQHKPYKEK